MKHFVGLIIEQCTLVFSFNITADEHLWVHFLPSHNITVVAVMQAVLGAGLGAPGFAALPGVSMINPAATAMPVTGFAPPGVVVPQLAQPMAAATLPGVVIPQLTVPQPGIVTPQLAGTVPVDEY